MCTTRTHLYLIRQRSVPLDKLGNFLRGFLETSVSSQHTTCLLGHPICQLYEKNWRTLVTNWAIEGRWEQNGALSNIEVNVGNPFIIIYICTLRRDIWIWSRPVLYKAHSIWNSHQRSPQIFIANQYWVFYPIISNRILSHRGLLYVHTWKNADATCTLYF